MSKNILISWIAYMGFLILIAVNCGIFYLLNLEPRTWLTALTWILIVLTPIVIIFFMFKNIIRRCKTIRSFSSLGSRFRGVMNTLVKIQDFIKETRRNPGNQYLLRIIRRNFRNQYLLKIIRRNFRNHYLLRASRRRWGIWKKQFKLFMIRSLHPRVKNAVLNTTQRAMSAFPKMDSGIESSHFISNKAICTKQYCPEL